MSDRTELAQRDDTYTDTIWPLVNSAFFLLLFVVTTSTVVVLYTMVGFTALRHNNKMVFQVTRMDGKESFNSDRARMTSSASDESGNEGRPARNTRDGDARRNTVDEFKSTKSTGGKKSASVKIPTAGKTTFFSNKATTKRNVKSEGDAVQSEGGDNEVIKYTSSQKSGPKLNMLQSPSMVGADVNLCMVRELTLKLKAAQRQNSSEEGREIFNDEKLNTETAKDTENNENVNLETAELQTETSLITIVKEKKVETKSVQFQEFNSKKNEHCNLNSKTGKSGLGTDDVFVADEAKEVNKGDISKVELGSEIEDNKNIIEKDRENGGGEKTNGINGRRCMQEHTNESSNTGDTISGINNETPDEAPISEFVRAMQWVDITYCLNETSAPKGDDDKTGGDNTSKSRNTRRGTLSSKSSISRKISRDNSFLSKHRKFRDTLSDTITRARARKSKKSQNGNEESEKHKNSREAISKSKHVSGKFVEDETTEKEMTKTREAGRSLNPTTLTLFYISVVYIVSFLPSLALMLWKIASPEWFDALSPAGLSIYNLALRSYFLNSAANPIIYIICDPTFRRECAAIVRQVFYCSAKREFQVNQ